MAPRLEAAVWNDVRDVVADPEAVHHEYERRLKDCEPPQSGVRETHRATRLQAAEARLKTLEAQAAEVSERHIYFSSGSFSASAFR